MGAGLPISRYSLCREENRQELNKNWNISLIVLILAVTGVILALAGSQYMRNYRMTIRDDLYRMLMNELTVKCMISRGDNSASRKRETMIYVLGSTQERLKYHFQTAATLYKEGVADRIYILSRPGITEYSPTMQRNLTNDEWAARELVRLGVPAGDVEAVPVPSGFFGTFSEGRRISRFARDRGYKRLVLVSSPHHTRRVYLTFSHFLGGGMDFFVCGSSDPAGMVTLMAEYAKIAWYHWVLIPYASRSSRSQKNIPVRLSRDDLARMWY